MHPGVSPDNQNSTRNNIRSATMKNHRDARGGILFKNIVINCMTIDYMH